MAELVAERSMFREAAHEASTHLHRLWDQREPEVRAALAASGVTITGDIDRPAFVAADQPVYRRFANQPEVRDLLAKIQGAP